SRTCLPDGTPHPEGLGKSGDDEMRRVYLAGFLLGAFLAVSCSAAETGREEAQNEAAAQPPGPHPGEAVYTANCAVCHDNPEQSKAPGKETLTRMSPGMIAYAMVSGKMSQQA